MRITNSTPAAAQSPAPSANTSRWMGYSISKESAWRAAKVVCVASLILGQLYAMGGLQLMGFERGGGGYGKGF